ncbi:MAG: N-acetylmuramoyl-L-alanine amidase [Lachnospiraceae bacterium]|nr:N-acetylmuramoyl-L-alanine amidase [Lachnospiraceae bacterium]
MDIKQWRKLTAQCVSLFALLLLACVGISNHYLDGSFTVMADEFEDEYPDAPEITPVAEEPVQKANREILDWQGDYIKVDKQSVGAGEVYLTNDYMEKALLLQVEHAETKSVELQGIARRYNGQLRQGKVQKKDVGDLLKSIKVSGKKEKNAVTFSVQIKLSLHKVMEPTLYETEDAYYVMLSNPREVFDKIIVVDAGHGGNDEGTYTTDGKYEEKAYTLAVVEELKKLFDQTNVKVYYTRLEDKEVSKKDRVSLANDVQADLFISVHCNASNPGDSSSHGVEALYSKRKTKSAISNKQLAEVLLDEVVNETGRRKRGVIRREDLYLMHHSKVPVSIVELAYITNKSDMKYLSQKKGRQKFAQGIYNGAIRLLG